MYTHNDYIYNYNVQLVIKPGRYDLIAEVKHERRSEQRRTVHFCWTDALGHQDDMSLFPE